MCENIFLRYRSPTHSIANELGLFVSKSISSILSVIVL